MQELTVVARAKAKPGRKDPAVFMVIERWASKEALDLHFAASYVQALLKKLQDLLVAPPEIETFELLPAGRSNKGTL